MSTKISAQISDGVHSYSARAPLAVLPCAEPRDGRVDSRLRLEGGSGVCRFSEYGGVVSVTGVDAIIAFAPDLEPLQVWEMA